MIYTNFLQIKNLIKIDGTVENNYLNGSIIDKTTTTMDLEKN